MVTFLIAAALAVLFGLAIRHLIKHGTCDCSSKGGCNGGCAGCSHSAMVRNNPRSTKQADHRAYARIERKGPLPLLSSGKKRYLFIIHELGQNGNAVHSKDIASSLSVKQPSVSKMLNALAEDGLIEKEYYGAATFTPEGARLSNKLYTDYLLLFSFFRKQLGLSESDSRHDAIVCLCDLSDAGVQRMASAVLDCEPCKQTQI